MKRILLFAVLLFATLSLIGQNVWKYPVYANGGIIVGAGQNITTPSIVLGSTAITATAAQLNVVYTDRLKWDGGSTGLTAATGRTSLGGTTAGQALFTLTNPSAITFLRVNADNTVTALSAANFRTATATVGIADTSGMLLKYARKASPTFTGTVTIPEGFYLGGSSVEPSAAELNVLNGISGGLTAVELSYSDGVTDYIQDQIDSLWQEVNDTIPGSTLYNQLNDTIPLTAFTLGRGLSADTALFDNNVIAGKFYNEGSDTLVVSQLIGILDEGTGTETISAQISWHATYKSGSATSLNAAALEITSITTGTIDASFANNKIPPNVWVWCILSGTSAGNRPAGMTVQLSGYKIPTY
ncbi:MAG: hypothetical protein WC554_02690 [Clostridia bacterium]